MAMEALFVLFVWIVVSWIVGMAARSRGRSWIAWFLLALVISPVIAILVLLAFAPSKNGQLSELNSYNDTELMKNIRRGRQQKPGA
jgi:hypothetical protein